MEIVVYSMIVLGGGAFIAYPLLREPRRATVRRVPKIERQEEMLAEKETVYAAINDLDFEYRTGKLSDDDYAELRKGYRARALNILKELDETQSDCKSTASRCAFCGHINPRGSNFCEECGAGLGGEPACEKCGSAHEPGDKFCGICGNARQ
jgi:RNA polymerase subunit RPABC4/transcription elongation factor Spt4